MAEETNNELINFDNFKTLGQIERTLSANQLAFIRKTVAKNITVNEQVLMLIYKALILGADLLLGEMIGYTDKQGNLVAITSKDFMLRRAYRTGDIERMENNAIYVREKDGEFTKCEFWETGAVLVGANALIKRRSSDAEVSITVRFSEYDKGFASWKSIPETMIKKVAMVQCLRLAFPNELAGIYDQDEIKDMGEAKEVKEVAILEDGDKPADENQLKTIEVLGGDASEIVTKQQAVEEINRLKSLKVKPKGGLQNELPAIS